MRLLTRPSLSHLSHHNKYLKTKDGLKAPSLFVKLNQNSYQNYQISNYRNNILDISYPYLRTTDLMKSHNLMNFIVSKDLIETFDSICSFNNQTRTSALIKLMRDYISDQSPIIRHQIESTQNLKNDLSNFKQQNLQTETYNKPKYTKFVGYKLRTNLNDPISFFSDGFSEDDQ